MSMKIKHPNNNCVFDCKILNNVANKSPIVRLSLKKPNNLAFGIAVPAKSLFERTPAVDLFYKKVIDAGFQNDHLDLVGDFVKSMCR